MSEYEEVEENKKGSWTYIGAERQSVIEYMIGNEKIREKIL